MRRRTLIAAVLLAGACGDDERLGLELTAPAPPDAGTSEVAPPPPPPDASDDVPAPPPIKRTVFERNPFGNVKESQNLVWDGDFEWFTPFAQQYGWVNAAQMVTVSAFEQVKVSPSCKSGMRCGYLTQNQRIAAVGVAPGGKAKVEASVWAKVPTECADIGVELIACDYAVDPDVPLLDVDGQPDADGWCRYEVIAEARERATCLYVEARFGEGEALVDDAVVKAAPAGAASSPERASGTEPAQLESARRAIRDALRPRPASPPQALVAFQQWAARPR